MSNIEHLEICNVYYNTSKLNNFTLSQYYNHMSDNCNGDNQIEKIFLQLSFHFPARYQLPVILKLLTFTKPNGSLVDV